MSRAEQCVWIVDDDPDNTRLLDNLLRRHYETHVSHDAESAMRDLNNGLRADLILLDIHMPEMSGFDMCSELKKIESLQDIPVIFLTGQDETSSEVAGLELGAVDYIAKPIRSRIVLQRIKTHIELSAYRNDLENQVIERTKEIQRTQDIAIFCMASLAETRDNETGNHLRRTQYYVKTLATYLRHDDEFAGILDDDYIELMFKSAPLHDIGKVGVPDRILKKPGKLDKDEWKEMKRHAEYGMQAIQKAEDEMGTTEFLSVAKQIAYCHHEKWDGSGYPGGLVGDSIPLPARFMALADVYDALTTVRVYKPAWTHDDACTWITERSGTHFDPRISKAFDACHTDFRDIAARFSDDAELMDG